MGERDWIDGGRSFSYDDGCPDDDGDPCGGEDVCRQRSEGPRQDDDGFRSRFVAEFVRAWMHDGGWGGGGMDALDAVEEAHAVFDQVFRFKDIPPRDYESAAR